MVAYGTVKILVTGLGGRIGTAPRRHVGTTHELCALNRRAVPGYEPLDHAEDHRGA
jgi:hypothetical protein